MILKGNAKESFSKRKKANILCHKKRKKKQKNCIKHEMKNEFQDEKIKKQKKIEEKENA